MQELITKKPKINRQIKYCSICKIKAIWSKQFGWYCPNKDCINDDGPYEFLTQSKLLLKGGINNNG